MCVRSSTPSWLRHLLLILLLAGAVSPGLAQRKRSAPKSKTQLERERRATLKRIKETSRILAQTQEKKQASVGQLNAIQEKLVVQQGVIKNISSELRYIETDVQQTEGQVQQTRQSLTRLKAEYGRLIYTASKTANGFNRLMFLFAAESFNQFLLRLRYIRQYTEVRQAQAAQITRTEQHLNNQLAGLQEKRQEKGSLLNTQLSEKKTLTTLKVQQDQVITKLTQQEESLRKELAARQQAVSRLDNLIAVAGAGGNCPRRPRSRPPGCRRQSPRCCHGRCRRWPQPQHHLAHARLRSSRRRRRGQGRSAWTA